MKTFTFISGFVVGFIALTVFASMILAGFWYCLDDYLATLVGVPAIGTLPFTFVWPATLLISGLFKASSFNTKSGS